VNAVNLLLRQFQAQREKNRFSFLSLLALQKALDHVVIADLCAKMSSN
jgi:hypothetical protein